MAYIVRVWACVECRSAVGEFGDGSLDHIKVYKSHTLMADTAKITKKDHEPDIGVELKKPRRWWTPISEETIEEIDEEIRKQMIHGIAGPSVF